MNSIKIAIAFLLDKIIGFFSKKEQPTPVQQVTETVVENFVHVHPTTTPAPIVEEAVTKTEEPKILNAKSRKKSKKG